MTDFCQRLGQSQPAVSHHLAFLRVSGLIELRREGKHNFYSVRTDHFGDCSSLCFLRREKFPATRSTSFTTSFSSYSGA